MVVAEGATIKMLGHIQHSPSLLLLGYSLHSETLKSAFPCGYGMVEIQSCWGFAERIFVLNLKSLNLDSLTIAYCFQEKSFVAVVSWKYGVF